MDRRAPAAAPPKRPDRADGATGPPQEEERQPAPGLRAALRVGSDGDAGDRSQRRHAPHRFIAQATDAGWATRRPGDPATRRPGDPATRRPGDPATRRPGDPATRRPGDPATRRPGDPATRRPGDPATRRPGDPATRRPGDPATRRPGDPATRRPGDPATRRPGDPATRRPGDPATRLIVTTASSGFVKCSREFVSVSLPFRPSACASTLPVARSAFRTLSNMVIASPPNLSPGMSRNDTHPCRASPILLLRTITPSSAETQSDDARWRHGATPAAVRLSPTAGKGATAT